MFLDKIKIRVKSGKGGDGCVSFRREKYVPRGGPNGGDGGNGGDAILEVNGSLNTLYHLYYTPYLKAENGHPGRGKNLHGKDGRDVFIKLPPGTLVYDETGKLLSDLTHPGERFIVVNGGRGGKGNARFKTSTNRAPRQSEPGKEGEDKTLLLELKLIADVGLVGYPNAGKSTLLAGVSDARPKIASYPFTTLAPNLGVCYLNYQKITFADVPGIIEDAHKGKGLGIDFLRHIERTKVLVFVLDVTQNPLNHYNSLRDEITQYNPLILKKPSLAVLNKIDLTNEPKAPAKRKAGPSSGGHQPLADKKIPLKSAIYISALKGYGIEMLLSKLKEKLNSTLQSSQYSRGGG